MRDFLFGHTRIWTGDLWISSPALYHCATVTSGFHLWQFQVFNSGAEGLVVVLFWLTCERFSSWPHQGLTQDLWISIPALYHCAIVTSGFHLWQFQVFNSGAEGLVVVLFWLDLWEIFFLATPGFEPGTSGSLVLHSTTVPKANSGFHLWQFQVFNSGAKGLVVVLFWLDLWEIFFLATPGFDPGTSGSLVLHSTTVPQWLLVFTSDNFRYFTLVQRDCWWYCSDWTCERFSFWPHRVSPRDLWISSPALYHCAIVTSGFHSDNFRYLTQLQRDWWWYYSDWPVRDFLFGHTRVWPRDLWISSPGLYHCATANSGFHLTISGI